MKHLLSVLKKKVAASYFCVNHYGFYFLISDNNLLKIVNVFTIIENSNTIQRGWKTRVSDIKMFHFKNENKQE